MRRHTACMASVVVILLQLHFNTCLAASRQLTATCACENGGTCSTLNSTCICNQDPTAGPTFRGATCQLASEECGSDVYCVNGGTCERHYNFNYPVCNCTAGFIGASCETEAVAPAPAPAATDCGQGVVCQNGGTCSRNYNFNYPICKCPTGFIGGVCEVDASALAPAPATAVNSTTAQDCGQGVTCQNGGTCARDFNFNYPICRCASGYAGAACEVATANLAPAPQSGTTVQSSSSGGSSSSSGSGGSSTSGGSSGGGGLAGWAIALVVVASVVVALSIGIVAFLVARERKGKPYFAKFKDGSPPPPGTPSGLKMRSDSPAAAGTGETGFSTVSV